MRRPARAARPFRRGDLTLLLVAAVAGSVFCGSLPRLWPLADVDLHVPRPEMVNAAREFLRSRGIDPSGYAAAGSLSVDEGALSYLERRLGREHTQALIADGRDGVPIVTYGVQFKRAGDPGWLQVSLHPDGQVVGWGRGLQEDEPAAGTAADAPTDVGARAVAIRALAAGLNQDPDRWTQTGVSRRRFPRRVDHFFTFERAVAGLPELRERASVRVSGGTALSANRFFVVPAAAARAARSREAPRQALFYLGTILFGVAVAAAFVAFLRALQRGMVALRRAALVALVVFTCALGTQLLQSARLFAAWDPLWPFWVSLLQYLVTQGQSYAWMAGVLLAVIAAGDALDRLHARGRRGRALWLLCRGRLLDRRVGQASARGFLVGLICGGVMGAGVLLLERFAGAETAIQPRGFFFYALNASVPALATLLYFLNVALLEELGYRFFAGTWLLARTRRPWAAVLIPAAIYGLTHTTLSFLPPAEPFWGRALVMTLVGCVWGWAFLRYDALTVVVSHLTADLFIFSWPRLASGDPALVAAALATLLVPLVPTVARAALGILRHVRPRPRSRLLGLQ